MTINPNQLKKLNSLILTLQKQSVTLESVTHYPGLKKDGTEKKTKYYKKAYKEKYKQLSAIEATLNDVIKTLVPHSYPTQIDSLLSEIDKMKPLKKPINSSEYSEEIDLYFNSLLHIQCQISRANGLLPLIIFDLNSMYLDYYDNFLDKQNSLISDNKKLESQIKALQEEIDHLKRKQPQPNSENKIIFTVKKEHPRGGCKLTDKQIERLLLIRAKRGKYADMTLSEAIKSIAQTHRTYYKVVNRDYLSEKTRRRIENIAKKLNIELPEI
ncbi:MULTISPECIES: hypothetical protein [Enterococcus]|uniref:Uncharacterized protein n=1 Tax=Enterococcus raffinosus TaxID=71452 RepID=A0AAP5KCH5_9ENTE|nr:MULTISPECIES: hypothetical protein [Enterococcus]SBA11418.1 hypothetical protein DTPHA_1403270 [Enterococcus faecium]MBS6429862.1 hypothetical protein [Enterococcus raffinosus]MDK7991254.1 hypothetical protein [Enterococcus raffinosus]MDT2524139.1 hypothetical protein [Enterococcus raffinosus]MDT2534880.1 hypothetical protein [Enterococcus raffinosus]